MHERYRITPGASVKLADFDPDEHGGLDKDDNQVSERTLAALDFMHEYQERMYAEGCRSLLIILQAMDAGGKDGTIEHVMSGLNPQACHVQSFKVPTPLELRHDFLWRVHQWAPRAGHIMVFNRSHYEDVLVVRVHKLVPESVWRRRYAHINNFEELLTDSGTRIIKFFLHISKDEQKERLEDRIKDPAKHWKLNPNDSAERALWDHYMRAYEEVLERCSTHIAPWYVIPANRKWYRNMVVAEIIADALREMDPQWPKPNFDVSTIRID
ncbi:MAG: polyphosphate kinase 2 family protein [Armatimonadetes bacterium]|nr:polyphosphate kinase 2 family protein [Armatimonadota bacterium]